MIAQAFLLAAITSAPVHLRGGDVVDAPVESVSLAGVAIGGPAPRTISWRRVRSVQGEHASAAEQHADVADALWRAATRLDRADVHGALELLPALENRYENQDGPTPVDVFTCALDAHLRVGDQPSALRAFFELARLTEDPDDRSRRGLDPAIGLPPTLAPILTPDHARAAQRHLAPRATDPPAVARLRAHYRAAISADPALLPEGGSQSPAELLLARMTRAQTADEQALTELREWAADANQPWRRAWVAAASARAGLRSTDPARVRQAALDYLVIPAFYAADAPYLAGAALIESADALERLGESSPARALRAELERNAPSHPALATTKDAP